MSSFERIIDVLSSEERDKPFIVEAVFADQLDLTTSMSSYVSSHATFEEAEKKAFDLTRTCSHDYLSYSAKKCGIFYDRNVSAVTILSGEEKIDDMILNNERNRKNREMEATQKKLSLERQMTKENEIGTPENMALMVYLCLQKETEIERLKRDKEAAEKFLTSRLDILRKTLQASPGVVDEWILYSQKLSRELKINNEPLEEWWELNKDSFK